MKNEKQQRKSFPEGEPAYIKAGLIKADPEYQRRLDPRRVEYMATNWEPKLVRVPRVSHRKNSTYAPLDGQHTIAAFIKRFGPDAEIFCEVFTGLTRQQEAEIFDRQKEGVVPPSAYDIYKSKVFRGEPVATAIDGIVVKFGLTVGATRALNTVCAISALERVYKVYGVLGPTLDVLKTWQDDRDRDGSVALDGRIMRMMGAFLSRYTKQFDGKRLLAVIKKHSPEQLLARATEKREESSGKRTGDVCGAMIIREWYNLGLRGRATLPKWVTDSNA